MAHACGKMDKRLPESTVGSVSCRPLLPAVTLADDVNAKRVANNMNGKLTVNDMNGKHTANDVNAYRTADDVNYVIPSRIHASRLRYSWIARTRFGFVER